jgi:hypothetical protein
MRGEDMRRRPRTRRWLKWGGLMLSLLIMVAWALCSGRQPHCWIGSFFCGVSDNRAYFFLLSEESRNQLRQGRWNPSAEDRAIVILLVGFLSSPSWRPSLEGRILSVPLWMPFLLVATSTVIFFWRDRSIPPNHCQRCRYNLTGNTSGVCPECGTAVVSTTHAATR